MGEVKDGCWGVSFSRGERRELGVFEGAVEGGRVEAMVMVWWPARSSSEVLVETLVREEGYGID